MQDRLLLRQYVMLGSEAAFAELIKRHQQLVYAAALREVGDRQTAEDVTQAVFLILAHKAPSLWNHAALTGWLFHTARLTGKSAVRQERRRRQREGAAAEMLAATPPCPPDETLRLNEALSALRPPEREAVLLRFFREASFSEVGAALGVSEDTAQKRVSRALDKMRAFLTQSGAPVVSVITLTGLLSAEAARPVPSGCGEAVLHVLPGLKITLGAGSLFSSRAYHISQGVLRTMKAKSFLKAAAVIGVACLSISALWAGSSPNGNIVGTWTTLRVFHDAHDNSIRKLILQDTYNSNGTFTSRAFRLTETSHLSVPISIITGRYTLKVLKKTGRSTSVQLSFSQATSSEQSTSYHQPPFLSTNILSDDGKTLTTVTPVTIYSIKYSPDGKPYEKPMYKRTDYQVWHRQ